MKILACVDFHNQYHLFPLLKRKAREADIVVCAGDVSVFEYDLMKTLRRMDEWGKKILMIHGNHEEESSLKKACKRLKNIDFFHGEQRVIKGVTFIGWGGGGFSSFDRALEAKVEEWKERGLTRPVVLVTHAPPYKTALDDLGYPVGSKSVRKAVKELEPTLLICGHIHETAGKEDVIKNTRMINPGPRGKIITL